MTLRTLIARSLRHYWRTHLGVVLGAAVGSAALLGALVVGDSVRESLRRQSLERLGDLEWILAGQDRLFEASLAERWSPGPSGARESELDDRVLAPVLQLPATAALPDGTARANQVQVLGVDARFARLARLPTYESIPEDGVILNAALAAQLRLKPGDTVLLRVHKPSALSREAIVSPQSDATLSLRLRLQAIAPASFLGNFSVRSGQGVSFNAFVSLASLQKAAETPGRANLLLASVRSSSPNAAAWRASTNVALWNQRLAQVWNLKDAELELAYLDHDSAFELRSPRVFLDPPVVHAALEAQTNAQPILTYLVNLLRAGDRATPYSMVTALPPALAPEGLRNDELLANAWLAEDLQLRPGDTVSLSYYLADSSARLIERTNQLRVRGVVPMALPYADRTFMPEFPGIAKAESTLDWDAGFRLTHDIREKDDAYWKQYRGTPKAFVTLAAGQSMWSNRFGPATAIRYPIERGAGADLDAYRSNLENRLLAGLSPRDLGLSFEPVRAQALAGASGTTDFGKLFLGFSFFIVIAALVLMALMFQFGLETRLDEIGVLLALGFTPGRVRGVLMSEGLVLAMTGSVLGVAGGALYARGLLWGLSTLWRDAVNLSTLVYHATPRTYLVGLVAASLVSLLTLCAVLRRQARRPARDLLAAEGGTELEDANPATPPRRWLPSVGAASAAAGIGLMGWAWLQGEPDPGAFFGAGSLFLVAGLCAAGMALALLGRSTAARRHSLTGLGLRGMTRQRKRSLAAVASLACGSFLIVAVGANRLDATLGADRRSSGTGGFALVGESSLPILRDLNRPEGLEFYGLDPARFQGVSMIPLRVREGDDASCLNLNRAQQPRLLGVDPRQLDERKAFTFAKLSRGMDRDHPWLALQSQPGVTPDEIPAIGDANSIRWALNKKLGDTIDYTDERGRPFKIRLVGAVANSILQGPLLIDEMQFKARFPSESGYRMTLIDAPPGQADMVAQALSRGLRDAGLELTPAARRLEAFNAVQNTYLNTFQVLGGLGILLGSAGLGVVVLRNVLERRGELALMQAVGFRRGILRWLVLSEHGALLVLGLCLGLVAALAAVLPSVLRQGASWPAATLSLLLGGVLVSGMFWTWLAVCFALRGNLLPALRKE